MAAAPGICISLLGEFRFYIGPNEIPPAAFNSRKASSLLKLLAITDKHQLHRDQALEAFWPGLDPLSASAQFYKAIHYIRKAFESAPLALPANQVLEFRNEFLRLSAPEGVHTDVRTFQELAKEALRTDALLLYRKAIACYNGDLLPADIYETWSDGLRESLRLTLKTMYTRAGEKWEQAGDLANATEVYRKALEIDAADEAIHRRLMSLFARQGQRTLALHQFKRCRELLERELEVQPEAETIRLWEAIRSGKLHVEPKAVGRSPGRQGGADALQLPSPPTLIGRETELASITDKFTALESGRGDALLIAGTAGVGKTHLVLAAGQRAVRRGHTVLFGQAFEGDKGLPYAPVVQALRMGAGRFPEHMPLLPAALASGIPELVQATAGEEFASGAAAQVQLFAGLLRFLRELARQAPVLMILDDFHLADEGTQKLMSYLVRNCRDLPLLLLGTLRKEEGQGGTAVDRHFALPRHADSGSMIVLKPLSRQHHTQLLQQILGSRDLDPALTEKVFSYTLGNPLFTIEMTAQLRAAGSLARRQGIWRLEAAGGPYIPPSLQILLAEKWNHLSALAQKVLHVAAVAGQYCDLPLLEQVIRQSSADLLDSLDACLATRLLQETGLGFRFSHPLFREAIYLQMSRARRAYYHRCVADYLQAAAPLTKPEAPVEAIAYHFQHSDDASLARPYFILAGDRAAALFAHEDAIDYYQQALQLATAGEKAGLHEKLGDQYALLGRELDSAAHFQAALATAVPSEKTRLHRKAAYRLTLAGELEAAEKHLQPLRRNSTRNAEWVRGRYVLAHYFWQKNTYRRALQIARTSLKVAEKLDIKDEVARAYEMLALCCVPLGEWQMGLEFEAMRMSRVDLNRYLADVSDVHL